MTNTQIMINFINHIISVYDDDFEVEKIVQHSDYKCRYKVVTRCDDYDLIVLCTQGKTLCVQWQDDIYFCQDGEWKCLATFY